MLPTQVMFLRNHGVVCCGSSIEEAFHICTNTSNIYLMIIIYFRIMFGIIPNIASLKKIEFRKYLFSIFNSLVAACDHQVKMMPLGLDNLVLIDDEVNIVSACISLSSLTLR